MKVLIVEKDPELGRLWRGHIRRMGASAQLVCAQSAALEALREDNYEVLILNLNFRDGASFALADYASYRRPRMKIIFVTSDSFFSDGSIFRFMSNACAMVPQSTPPEDLAALVDYHGR